MKKFLFLYFLCMIHMVNAMKETITLSFPAWKTLCNKLQKYEQNNQDNPTQTALNPQDFIYVLNDYFNSMEPHITNKNLWYNNAIPQLDVWKKNTDKPLFEAFVQKQILTSNSIVAVHGDFHGDVHAMNDFIEFLIKENYINNDFKIINNNFYILFLGDYTDRGWYGAEVIYTLLRLARANPKKVFIIRGNHEEQSIIAYYGFQKEIETKFPDKAQEILSLIYRFYNHLPLACYIGCGSDKKESFDFIQACHGGIELGFNPQDFLKDTATYMYLQLFNRHEGYKNIENIVTKKNSSNIIKSNAFRRYLDATAPDSTNGFMWNDFDALNTYQLSYNPQRGLEFGEETTKTLLTRWSTETHRLCAIFRAHQHATSGAMRKRILNEDNLSHEDDAGIGKLWIQDQANDHKHHAGRLKGVSAVTFSVAPGTPYKWPYDAFSLVTLRPGYNNWGIKTYRITEEFKKKLEQQRQEQKIKEQKKQEQEKKLKKEQQELQQLKKHEEELKKIKEEQELFEKQIHESNLEEQRQNQQKKELFKKQQEELKRLKEEEQEELQKLKKQEEELRQLQEQRELLEKQDREIIAEQQRKKQQEELKKLEEEAQEELQRLNEQKEELQQLQKQREFLEKQQRELALEQERKKLQKELEHKKEQEKLQKLKEQEEKTLKKIQEQQEFMKKQQYEHSDNSRTKETLRESLHRLSTMLSRLVNKLYA